MSVMRLLSSKADVIKSFQQTIQRTGRIAAGSGMYLGDIQDHIVTMLQALAIMKSC